MISTHLYFDNRCVSNDMGIYFSKEIKNPKHSKPTYLSNYLNIEMK
jgi:hypothetical protein